MLFVRGDGGAVVGVGAEVFGLGFDFEDFGVEAGLLADLEGEEVGGALFEALGFGGGELLGEIDVVPGLAEDFVGGRRALWE